MPDQYAYCGIFTDAWNNPPSGFNPDYRPYAERLSNETRETLEAEGAYKNFTLSERQNLNLWRDMYEQLRVPYEAAFLRSNKE